MSRFAKLKALSVNDWKALLASMILLPCVAVQLRLLEYSRAQKAFLPAIPDPLSISQENPLDEVRRVSRLVEIAAHHGFYHASCLERSLVLAWFLRRRNIPYQLRIGVRRAPVSGAEMSAFSAHAWVDSRGIVVNDDKNVGDRFSAFDSRPDDPNILAPETSNLKASTSLEV